MTLNLFKRLEVDLIDYSHSPDGLYKYIYHIKNHFSRFFITFPLKEKTAAAIAACLEKWIHIFDAPIIVQTNNKGEFKKDFNATVKKYNIKYIYLRLRHS